MRRKFLIRVVTVLALATGFFCSIKADKVYAGTMSGDALYKLSIMRGVYKCYDHAYERIRYADFKDESDKLEAVFDTGGKWGKTSSDEVYITTHVGNTLSSDYLGDSDLSCKQIFNGYSSNAKGFKDYYSFPKTLEGWGYVYGYTGEIGGGNVSNNKVDIVLNKMVDNDNLNSNPVEVSGKMQCSGEEKEGRNWWNFWNTYYYWHITDCSGSFEAKYNGESKLKIVATTNGTGYAGGTFTVDSNNNQYLRNVGHDDLYIHDQINMHVEDEMGKGSNQGQVSFKSAIEGSDFAKDLKLFFEESVGDIYSKPTATLTYNSSEGQGRNGNPEDNDAIYEVAHGTRRGAAFRMLNKVGFDDALPYKNESRVDEKYYVWSSYATYSLYFKYLENMIKDYPEINMNDCSESKPSSKYAFKNSPNSWCAINIPTTAEGILEEAVSIVRGDDLTIGKFSDVLNWLNKESNYKDLKDDQYAGLATDDDGNLMPSEDPEGVDPGGSEEVEPTCANSGGADKLGWIICPVMEWAIDASKKMYDQYIEPALQVDPILFTGGESSDNTAKSAWNIFRNIANILFAILFLVVIFSQLTGVGIDNYGIKKILPKLILTALLVNLSYYICMVCVDLSNIFGNGLQSILDGMAKGMTISIDGKTPGDAGVGATAISAVAILATLGIVGVAIWSNPAILLPLVISAIGVVIAILFLFVLLSARQAAILMLTVVSPIAFACYMLPNTKKLFDKWLKIGEGLLLVYPICGIMVGGGNFASKLLITTSAAGGSESNGFFQAFTAMLIGIVPIFFIPSTLKGAFAALGNIGAKLSGFGDKVRSGATRGMRNSNLNKRLQERGLENKTRFNAGYKRNGEKKDLNGFQRFIRGGRRNVQRSAIAYQKNVSDKGSLDATEGKDFMLQTQTANVMKELNASGEINSIKDLGTGLEKALVSGDRARIRAYTDALSSKGENGRIAVGEAYDSAVRQGMASNARKTFADNIMTNHAADYKNNSRGIYELAKGINTGSRDIDNNTTVAGYVGSHRADLARKVTSTTIGNMDDDAWGGIFGGYNANGADPGSVSLPDGLGDDERAALGATIYAALNDQNANIKSGRRSVLQKALELTGYNAEPKTVRIDGGAGAQAGGGAPAVPAAQTGVAQEGQVFNTRTPAGGGAPTWDNYNITSEMRDEFISQGLAPGDAEIDQYRRR